MFNGVFITTIKFVRIQGPYKRDSHDARRWCQDFVLQGVKLLQKTLVVTSTLLTSMAICQWTLWNSQVVPSIKCKYKIQVIGSHFKSDITWGWYSDWHPCIEFASWLRTIVNPHNLISDSEASKNLHCWYVKVARNTVLSCNPMSSIQAYSRLEVCRFCMNQELMKCGLNCSGL